MADPIRQALERLQQYAAAHPEHDTAELVAAALAALAAEPPAPGPTIDDIWEMCEDHEFHLGDGANDEESAEGLLQIINAALARWGNPAPATAADDEREELIDWLDSTGELAGGASIEEAKRYWRAAALLREACPQPVPVADRPWERPGWCDAKGRCWFGAPVAGAADAGWILRKPSERLSHQTVSLTHWAIPQPPQGGEVGA